jgi:hypothetical protein
MPVKVWFVRDGPQEQRGNPAYEVALQTCVDRIGLTMLQRIPLPEGQTPRFGDQSVRRSELDPYQFVVCEIDEAEANLTNWRAGYYHIALGPEEVIAILGPPHEPGD